MPISSRTLALARAFRVPFDRVAAFCAAAIAVPVVVGWHLGAWGIVRPSPTAPPMVYNTALCIGACAVATLIGRGRRFAGAFTTIIAGVTLAEYATGRSYGIETAIYAAPVWLFDAVSPARMAPNTAASLLLISTALLAFPADRRVTWLPHAVGVCLSAGVAIPIVAGAGYFIGIRGGYAWGEFTPMAPHTAAALSLLSIGLLWRVCVAGWTSIGRSAPAWLPIPIALTIASVGVLLYRALKVEDGTAGTPLPAIVLANMLVLSALFGLVLSLARRADVRRREAVEATRLLNLILDTMPVGVFVANRQGALTASNPEGRRIWGAPHGTPAEYGAYRVWTSDSGAPLARGEWGMAKAIQRGETTLNEVLEIEAFDGSRKTIQHSAVPVREADGAIVGGVVVIQDVTARVRAERLLVDRTRELQRSNAELAQFAYVASHDLQEPLRMVSSYTQLIARRYRGRLDTAADEFIHFAVDGAHRMQQLIDALLQYSRVGTQGGAFEPVSMDAVLADVVKNLRVLIDEQHAQVTHDPLPEVTGDRVQLTQLLQNLIANGIKFRRDEAPRVHVSVARGAAGAVFSVEDNGIGIEPRFAERVFVIFQRLHPRERYPGTGIGLALCRKIVARHGGAIWVEPRPAQPGSTFKFTLEAGTARSAA
jgi:PAS domain S-box-containing protein